MLVPGNAQIFTNRIQLDSEHPSYSPILAYDPYVFSDLIDYDYIRF